MKHDHKDCLTCQRARDQEKRIQRQNLMDDVRAALAAIFLFLLFMGWSLVLAK